MTCVSIDEQAGITSCKYMKVPTATALGPNIFLKKNYNNVFKEPRFSLTVFIYIFVSNTEGYADIWNTVSSSVYKSMYNIQRHDTPNMQH